MGCTKIGHRHVWPTEGLLIIQRCETRCNFCTGEGAKKSWKYAWFLRRHVRAIHVGKKGQGQYPNLIVDDSWDDSKLYHMQLKSRLAQKSGTIKFIEQPEFEEQSLGGFHPGSAGHIKPEGFGDDVDIFNNGPPEFYQNPNGTYPSLADEEVYASITNPFQFCEIEAFIYNATLGQTEFDTDQPESFVESEEVNENGMINGDGALKESGVVNENGALGESAVPEGAVYEKDVHENVIDENGGNEGALHDEYPNTATVAPAQVHSDPAPFESSEPDWAAAPKFFMADYEYDSDEEDSLDDLPLVQTFDRHQTKPLFEDYGRFLSMLDNGAEKMANEGMQPADMLPCLSMFARGLMSRNESRTPVPRAAEPDMA